MLFAFWSAKILHKTDTFQVKMNYFLHNTLSFIYLNIHLNKIFQN